MSRRINILNCPIDNLTMEETIEIIHDSLISKKPLQHTVVNAAKLVNMQKDKTLYNAVVNSDLINADGQAVVWASRFLNQPLPERVTGIDLMQNLVALAHQKKYKIFFLGAKEEVVSTIVAKYTHHYGNEIIAGYRNGYYSTDEEKEVVKEIAESKADILLVAISSPKKEIFLEKYKNKLNATFIMGVGGSFDVIAGKVARAPEWMQKTGFEWLYRLIQEPKRMWKRYLFTNVSFIVLLIHAMVKKDKL